MAPSRARLLSNVFSSRLSVPSLSPRITTTFCSTLGIRGNSFHSTKFCLDNHFHNVTSTLRFVFGASRHQFRSMSNVDSRSLTRDSSPPSSASCTTETAETAAPAPCDRPAPPHGADAKPESLSPLTASASATSANASSRRLLRRCFLTLGIVGFLAGILYDTQTKASNSSRNDPGSSKSIASIFSLQTLEDAGEVITDYLQDVLDKLLPHPTTPLLPDAEDLKYPDNLPTLVVDFDKVIVKMEHDRKRGWRVLKRPGADEFFKELVYHYEIVIWSDDSFPVAQDVCGTWGLPVVGVLHRDQCKKRRKHYIKDLSRLGRQLQRVLILDHDPAAFSMQPGNGILISEFDGNPNDTDLKALTEFLKMAALSPHADIRDFVEEHGGGDIDLVKRWVVQQAEKEKKSETRRHLCNRFFGNKSGAQQTPGVLQPQTSLSSMR